MYRLVLRKTCNDIRRNTEVIVWNQSKKHLSTGGAPLEAGFGKFLIILTPIAAVGSVAAYAKYDNEFRKTLIKTVPAAEPALKVILGEENPLAGVQKTFKDTTTTVTDFFGSAATTAENAKNTVTGFFGSATSKAGDVASEIKSKADSLPPITSTIKSKFDAIPVPAPAPPTPPKSSPISAPQETKPSTPAPIFPPTKKTPVQPTKAAAVVPTLQKLATPEVIPKSYPELETKIEATAASAVAEYNKAISVLKSYNNEVKRAVDESIDRLDNSVWTSLKNKTNAKNSSVSTAENAAQDARETLQNIQKNLDQNKIDLPADLKKTLGHKIKTCVDHLDSAKTELFKSKEISQENEKYWKKVETARNYFIDEMEALFPGINLSEKKLNLEKDELDLFVAHAFAHVLSYQKELQKLQIDGETRIRRALETLRGDDQVESLKAQLDFHLDKEKHRLNIENQKKIFKIQADAEKEVRLQMKRQAEAHTDHLKDVVTLKEGQLKRVFEKELGEKLSVEQAAYKMQLASMLGKLKGMDAALKARAGADKSAQQAQALWGACQALWSQLRAGDPKVSWEKRIRPLDKEIKAIGKAAAEGDELVDVVVKSLPKEASTRGIFPEDALRERFLKVEKIARRLALVPENGARLPTYILSYLQSMFIVSQSEPITKDELLDKEIDFSKLDTYDILNRARYWLDHGDLMKSLQYMNLLTGAPRKIASDWMTETRLHLETQQAVSALLAHAAASGIKMAS